jgi:hypothetical protein
MKRIDGQMLAAFGVLAVLALSAVLTARPDQAALPRYASTDYGEAGYRAWATLLTREGVPTTRFILRPIELDDRIDTLISAQSSLTTDPAARTSADVGALAAWVRRGGRLVYLGRDAPLRDAEGLLLQLPQFLPAVGERGHLMGALAAEVPALHGLGPDRMLLIEHPGSSELSDGNGDIVVRYALGRGEIIAMSGPLALTNLNIGRADNGRLAFLIGRPRRPGGTVAFDDGLHGALIDRPWYRALPVPVRAALAFTALALVLGLIGSALPGAPPITLRPAREPSSAEFIDALAALYARTKARAFTRAILAGAAVAAAARSVGCADDASADVVAQRLGERPGAQALRRLARMLDEPIASDADLIASARLAYLVRKDSRYGGNGDGRRAAFAGRTRTRPRRE